MSGILVVAETRRGQLCDVSRELVGASREVASAAGLRVTAAVIGADAERLAPGLDLEGVDEIVAAVTASERFEAHVWQSVLEALIETRGPSLVLLAHTVDTMGFASAVAARRALGFASDVTAVGWIDGLRAWREPHGGRLRMQLAFAPGRCTLLTIRPGSYDAATAASGYVTASQRTDLSATARSEHVSFREPPSGEVDITRARLLLSIGRPVAEQADVERFAALAERLGGTLSASRAPVEAGLLERARAVGQSGKTVTPRVYLALGIAGAPQHLAGIAEADTIIAVNTDPQAPIFAVADYGAVADLFEVGAELARALG